LIEASMSLGPTAAATANDAKPPHSIFVISLILSAGWTAACYLAGGPTLALFWGGFFAVTFFSPAAALTRQRWVYSLYASAGPACGAMAVWLPAVLKTEDTLGQWFSLAVALTAYGLAISGIAMLARRGGWAAPLAAGFAVLIGMAWLSWPVWLAPEIPRLGFDRAAQPLVDLNPLLVANGVLTAEPPWTERAIAYQLTNLNQDVPMQLPGNAAKCVAICLLAAGASWGLSREKAKPDNG
jgi:hypothetical protein